MRFCSIASGSSGNCLYVGSDTTHLLVDAGISGKKTEAGLNELGISGKDIDGVLITHEHSDHIMGLGILSRKYQIPIYATKGTIKRIKIANQKQPIDDGLFHEIHTEESFYLKDIKINSMKISHDAAEPVAYRFACEGRKIGIATDLGKYDDYILGNMRGMDLLFLESNHDVHMLQVGPYPYLLKQRILGERGHLSNESAGRMLTELMHDNLKAIFLGHLSKENNLPELAYETVRLEITMSNNAYSPDDFPMYVAPRSVPSSVIEF